MKLTLTKEQRRRFFDGECPHISGTDECPVGVGYEYRLSRNLSFRVSKVHTDRDGWWLRYVVIDTRHTVRNLRRTPQATDFDDLRESFDEYGYPPEATAEAIDDASQESSYTSRGTGLVANAGESPSAEALNKYAEKASDASANLRRQRMAEAQKGVEGIASLDLTREAKRRLRRVQHDLAAIHAEVEDAA